MRQATVFLVAMAVLLPCATTGQAMNANLWEREAIWLTLINPKEPKQAQLRMARQIFCQGDERCSALCNSQNTIDSSYSDETNRISIAVPDDWKGLAKFDSMYHEQDQGRLKIFTFILTFALKTLTIDDVLARYGRSYLKIETDENFQRYVMYTLNANSALDANSPLFKFSPIHRDRIVSLTFTSRDKTTVDSLLVGVAIIAPKGKGKR